MITSLSNSGYSIKKDTIDENEYKKIKKELKVSPKTFGDFGVDVSFELFTENDKKIYIPKYYGIKNYGFPNKIKNNNPKDININCNIKLKKIQEEIVEKFKVSIKDNGGGIISAKCGLGKTVLSIYLISMLKVKTLVLVHKNFLLDQWIEEINRFTTNVKIGIIKGDKCDVIDKDIVIGSIQTLCKDKFPKYIYKEFGFLICDEAHHLCAKSFSKSLRNTSFKYTLGLSATPNRDDGLTPVFINYLGPIFFKSKIDKSNDIDITMYQYNDKTQKYCEEVRNYRGNLMNPTMINNIASYKPRNQFIITLIKPLLDEGRKVLILTERISQVNYIIDELEKLGIQSGKYIGGMKKEQRDASLEYDLVIGTYSMIEEGFNCPKLDTLIMITPKSNKNSLEQSIGRILRKKKEDRERTPLVIDIWDLFGNYKNQGYKRIKFYKRHGYNIKQFSVKLNKDKKTKNDNDENYNFDITSINDLDKCKKKKKDNDYEEPKLKFKF